MLWLAVGGSARADASAHVVCVDPHDRELVARIEGQTRDLALGLSWVDEPIASDAQASDLEQVAERHAADLVVAVQPRAAGGLTVYVYDRAQQQLRVREAPRPLGVERLATSTLAETAALIVRGELTAVLSARAASVSGADSTAPAAPNTAEANSQRDGALPPIAADPAQPPNAGEDASRSERGLSLAAGIRAGLAGTPAPLVGPWLGARLTLLPFEVGLTASTALPSEFGRQGVRISVRRHALAAEALGLLALPADLELGVGVDIGLVLYARQTRLAADSSLMQAPDASAWSALFGPFSELRWRFAHSIGVALRLGVDVNPQPTRFVYRQAGAQTELAKLAVLEVWGAATLFVDIWK